MTEFELLAIELLTEIRDSLATKAKKKAKQADLLDQNHDRAARGRKALQPMPEPFVMTAKHRQFAAERGFPHAEFMFDSFKAHHRAKGSQFASWDAAWQTWVLNQVKYNGGTPQQPRPNGGMDGRI